MYELFPSRKKPSQRSLFFTKKIYSKLWWGILLEYLFTYIRNLKKYVKINVDNPYSV